MIGFTARTVKERLSKYAQSGLLVISFHINHFSLYDYLARVFHALNLYIWLSMCLNIISVNFSADTQKVLLKQLL